jgi:hypothetical protein
MGLTLSEWARFLLRLHLADRSCICVRRRRGGSRWRWWSRLAISAWQGPGWPDGRSGPALQLFSAWVATLPVLPAGGRSAIAVVVAAAEAVTVLLVALRNALLCAAAAAGAAGDSAPSGP